MNRIPNFPPVTALLLLISAAVLAVLLFKLWRLPPDPNQKHARWSVQVVLGALAFFAFVSMMLAILYWRLEFALGTVACLGIMFFVRKHRAKNPDR